MNMDKLNITLRKAVSAVHRDYFNNKTISEDAFVARRDRLNKVLKRTAPHKQTMKDIIAAKQRVIRTSRFLAHKRQEINNGARVIIILNIDDANITLLQLDGSSTDIAVDAFKHRDYKNDILVASSFAKAPVQLNVGIDLYGMCNVLGIDPEGGVVENLATHFDVHVTDRVSTIIAVTKAVIYNFPG